jgi:predicted metalloprotease with PDZ domain
MRKLICLSIFLVLPLSIRAQASLTYQVNYAAPGSTHVRITLILAEPIQTPVSFVMPRTYPGGYEQIPYDSFVEQIQAFSPDEKPLSLVREEYGPRWTIGDKGARLTRIEYEVDIARMENRTLSSVETSKARPGYVGLLGYSVFGFIDGLEESKINLHIAAPNSWPILTTLNPQIPAPTSTAEATAPNYYALADSQILLGPNLHILQFPGKISLILAVYSEATEDLQLEGQLARQALDRVQAYFADTPFRQYTVQLELLRPLPDHDYGFSQEHLDSGTFSLSTSRAITPQSSQQARDTNLFNYAHHMAHSWIPKRAYGTGYQPFTWELTPVIDTIWFNEGFARYAAIEAIAQGLPPQEAAAFRARHLARLREIVDSAPPFLRHMPLDVLSREASFVYATDFRTGMNVFARGALMAAEMDDEIRAKSANKKSLQDALQALLAWNAQYHRAFQIQEMLEIFHTATSVDVQDILNRWMHPPTN